MSDAPAASCKAANEAILVPTTGYFLSLHTGDPGTTGASEGTDGRQAITFGNSTSAVPSVQSSTSSQSWSSAVGGQTYGWFGVWTLTSSGTYLRGGSLTASITPPTAAQITAATGAFTFNAS